jgi:hypothetical protein
MVMPVGLAVSGNIQNLGPLARRRKPAQQTLGEIFPPVQNIFEGHCL